MTTLHTTIDSPIGPLTLTGDGAFLTGVRFGGAAIDVGRREDAAAFAPAVTQLHEYFHEGRETFDLAIELRGTPFQVEVWEQMRAIPYGETMSYGELAQRVGRPRAVRAVGAASGRNPIGVVVPCHRVIGTDGSLTGFGGGLQVKRALLDLELTPSLF